MVAAAGVGGSVNRNTHAATLRLARPRDPSAGVMVEVDAIDAPLVVGEHVRRSPEEPGDPGHGPVRQDVRRTGGSSDDPSAVARESSGTDARRTSGRFRTWISPVTRARLPDDDEREQR